MPLGLLNDNLLYSFPNQYARKRTRGLDMAKTSYFCEFLRIFRTKKRSYFDMIKTFLRTRKKTDTLKHIKGILGICCNEP